MMSAMRTLLVVHHSPTAATRALADSVVAGARDDAIEGVEVLAEEALCATARQVGSAAGLVLVTPANFGYMSGALKHFFDSTFLQIGGALGADGGVGGDTGPDTGPDTNTGTGTGGTLPFALAVHGRYDVVGAVRSVLTITAALPWRQAAPVLEVVGEVTEEHRAAAYELGATVAALLSD
jgi:hypothetical protein